MLITQPRIEEEIDQYEDGLVKDGDSLVEDEDSLVVDGVGLVADEDGLIEDNQLAEEATDMMETGDIIQRIAVITIIFQEIFGHTRCSKFWNLKKPYVAK